MNEKISNEDELTKALKASNQLGKPVTFQLADMTISKRHDITAPVSLVGPALLTYKSGGGLSWKKSPTGLYTAQAKSMGELVQTDAPVKPGSYIICQSNDKIAVEPHNYNGTQHPQEIHQVNYYKGDMAGVESFTVDRMDGNLSILEPLDHITIKDIDCVFDDAVQTKYSTAIKLDGVTNALIENVNFLRSGPGAIWLNNAYGCRIQGCRIDGTFAGDDVYGLVVGTVNNVLISDCFITGCRHAFTTTAGTSKGIARWGTPLNVVLKDSIINVPTKIEVGPNATRVGLDTHAEGYGVTFLNCIVNVGGATSNYGGFIRSRAAVFKGCTFNGGMATKAIEIYASDCLVDSCVFNNFWIGVAAKKIRGIYCGHTSVFNCTFNNLSGPAVYFETGANHKIHNLALNGVMKSPGSKFKDFKVAVIGDYTEI